MKYMQGCRFGTMEPQVVPEGLVWCQEQFFLVPDNLFLIPLCVH